MLPDTDGIELMRGILDISDVPVIFLSGYGRDTVIAGALQAGAADYVVKPFSPTELVARIQAALRRRLPPVRVEPAEPYVLGDLTIDYAERLVTVAGRPVQLTATEYALLFELSVHAGRVDPRPAATTGLGIGEVQRRTGDPHPLEETSPQAGRGRGEPHLHLRRASRRLPHGEGGDNGNGGAITLTAVRLLVLEKAPQTPL